MTLERTYGARALVRLAASFAAARLLLHLLLRFLYNGYPFVQSPTEIARTEMAAHFAASPSLMPQGITYWLPLQSWLTGSLLRVWPDVLAVPFAVNTAASMLSVAAVVLLAGEAAGAAAAAVAGAAALLSGLSLIQGIGGSADPLMHAAAAWGLLFWLRFERGGRPRDAWLCALCLALGAAVRYEIWCVIAALSAAAVWDRRRAAALPLLAAWAIPLSWPLLNLAYTGDALRFLHVTLEADLRAPNATAWLLALDYAASTFDELPLWLWALVLGAAAGAARFPRSYWLCLGAVGLFFAGTHQLNSLHVDFHQQILFVLALPAGATAAASWLASLSPERRRAAAAVALLLLGAREGTVVALNHVRFTRRLLPIAEPFIAARELRRDGRLLPGRAVLVELPRDRTRLLHYKVWHMEPASIDLFDRELPPQDAGGRFGEYPGPSVLDRPAPELRRWLDERWVDAVAASEHDAVLTAAGWRREGALWRPAPQSP